MFLAGVLSNYKEELICDLAEYYSIYDYESHPPQRVAILIKGLRENSRIMNKIAKIKNIREDILLTAIFDNLNWLLWTKTKDGQKNRNKPKQLLNFMINNIEDKQVMAYTSSEDFVKERERIINEIKKGGA